MDTIYIVFRCSKLWGQEVLRTYVNPVRARQYAKELSEKNPYFNYIVCPKKIF